MVRPAADPPGRSAEERRRLDEVFGDVLPSTTSDERDDADPGATERGPTADDELLANRPPHHDRG